VKTKDGAVPNPDGHSDKSDADQLTVAKSDRLEVSNKAQAKLSKEYAKAQAKAERPKGRMGQAARDMLLSIGAALALVGFIAFFTFRPGDDSVKAVDYKPIVASARTAGAFDVAVPSNLGSEWIANDARYRTAPGDFKVATWHIGFVRDRDAYVGVFQTNGTDQGFVKESTADGKPGATVDIAGTKWVQYDSSTANQRSLLTRGQLNQPSTGASAQVKGQAAVTTIVTGTQSFEELAAVAASLRTS